MDGHLSQINELQNGWTTNQYNDWIYYDQQYVNVSLSNVIISVATVGGCVGQNRHKPSGFLYNDNGRNFSSTGNKITSIANAPIKQTIPVKTSYIQYFVDDGVFCLH